MKRTLIRYKTKPEQTQTNEQLIAKVFEELGAQSPEGVRYLCLKLADGSFVHFVSTDTDEAGKVIPALSAFQTFQQGIKDRCAEPPVANEVTIVGDYRMLAERPEGA